MTAVVELIVHNLDLNNDHILDSLSTFGNVMPGTKGSNGTLAVFVEDGQQVVSTVMTAVSKLMALDPRISVQSVDPDLVSASDIASRTGLSREAVRQWHVNPANKFPNEFSSLGNGQKVWRWVDVVEWLYLHRNLDLDEEMPSRRDINLIDERLLRLRNTDKFTSSWSIAPNVSRTTTILPSRRNSCQFTVSTNVGNGKRQHYREEAYCAG